MSGSHGAVPELTPAPESRGTRVATLAGVGCFTAFCGFFSGGMTGVLISKIVAGLTKAPKCADLPTCDWHVYAGVGMVIGAITLPVLVLLKMRRMEKDEAPQSQLLP